MNYEKNINQDSLGVIPAKAGNSKVVNDWIPYQVRDDEGGNLCYN